MNNNPYGAPPPGFMPPPGSFPPPGAQQYQPQQRFPPPPGFSQPPNPGAGGKNFNQGFNPAMPPPGAVFNQPVIARPPSALGMPQEVTAVYVGKIPTEVENEVIKKLLEQCGRVSNWKRFADPVSGELKAFGFCDYANQEGALKAIRLLNGKKMSEELPTGLLLKVDEKTQKKLDQYLEVLKALSPAVPETPEDSTEEGKKMVAGPLASMERDDEFVMKNINNVISTFYTQFRPRAAARANALANSDSKGGKYASVEHLVSSEIKSFREREIEKKESRIRNEKDMIAREAEAQQREQEREKDRQKRQKERDEREFKARERDWEIKEVSRARERERDIKNLHPESIEEDTLYMDITEEQERDLRRKMRRDRARQHREQEFENDRFEREKEERQKEREKRREEERQLELLEKQKREEEQKLLQMQQKQHDQQKAQLEFENRLAQQNKEKTLNVDPSQIKLGLTLQSTKNTNKRTLSTTSAFSVDGEEDDLERSIKRQKLTSLDEQIKAQQEKEQKMAQAKRVLQLVPVKKNEIFAYEIQWDLLQQHDIVEQRMKPWVTKKIIEFLEEEEKDLIEFIVTNLNEKCTPQQLAEDIKEVLDDETEDFMVKLWRMLIFEQLCIVDSDNAK